MGPLLLLGIVLVAGFSSATHVEEAFIQYGVQSDVVSTAPEAKIEIRYPSSKKYASLGNELKPIDVRQIPEIKYDSDKDAFYTLAMVDPDAPSRKTPTSREFLHWLVTNIPGNDVSKGKVIAEYVGSGPPKNTALHRYVFLVYKQPKELEFNEKYLANTDGNRRKFSIKKFAEKYELGSPIAGNFYQAQYDDSVPDLHKQLGF